MHTSTKKSAGARSCFFESPETPSASADTESTASAASGVTATGDATSSPERESLYVELLQDIICTVLDGENHLFAPDEIECFSAFLMLDHDARHLFVRLLQRKREWLRVDRLAYPGDVIGACEALCCPFAQPSGIYRFAAGDAEMPEAGRLDLLTLDELRGICKRLGIPRLKTREAVVRALLAPDAHMPLFGAKTHTQRLEEEVHAALPCGCIRLEEQVCTLFDRLALVYYRGRPVVGTLVTTALLARTRRFNFPKYTLSRSTDIFPSREHLLRFQQALDDETAMDTIIEERSADAARRGAELLDAVLPAWEHAVRELWIAFPDGISLPQYARMRFHYGWVYTRVIHKACECLARLHKSSREECTLRALLSQRFFQRGRRGGWYERLAVICTREKGKQAALDVCIRALGDPDTHVVNLFALQRRVERLETQLGVRLAQRHRFSSTLQEAPRVNFAAVRGGERGTWMGREGPCSVEQFCLEQYEQDGFCGAHDEGASLLFLFVLLMWDILFQPVPGAFETAFQREPLDLGSDVFYHSRRSMIDARLSAIRDGAAPEILARTDRRERPRRTWAIACRWDKYSHDDLQVIAQGLGGHTLAHLCRLLAQEWSLRTSGLPDLTLWKPGKVAFCEVKAPRDRLSEKQRVWIDAMLAGGARVEIAQVRD